MDYFPVGAVFCGIQTIDRFWLVPNDREEMRETIDESKIPVPRALSH